MRVISGKYKNRKIIGHNIEGTRPTMDRIKESISAMIQCFVNDAIVLDLFAGTGALGLEMLSNNCQYCYFVDNNKDAIKAIKENTKNIPNHQIIKSDYKIYLNQTRKKFDIIILDPPYKMDLTETIDSIIKNKLLTEAAIIICEVTTLPKCNLKVLKEKIYKDKKVIIYQNMQ